jgi:hypothetical protein
VVLKISYDTNLLDVAANGIRTGSLTSGGNLLVNVNDAAGTIIVSLLTSAPLSAGAGSLLEIDFQIRTDAVAGATPIDIQSLSLNEGQLVLTIEPVVGADGTDGSITIVLSAAIPSASIEKVDAPTIDAESATVTQSVAPVTAIENIDTLITVTSFSVGVNYGMAKGVADNALNKFSTLLDLDRDRTIKDLRRAVTDFDMPLISLNERNDLSDDGWLSPHDIHRRMFGSNHRRAPKIQWD